MKRLVNNLQKPCFRLALCAVALGLSSPSFAQDELDEFGEEETTTVKKPKREAPNKKYPTVAVKGVVLDQATKKPLAGVQLQALGNNKYSAMTDETGTFTIKVPTFATALYVFSPEYMSQQVGIVASDSTQKIRIEMLPDKFRTMYSNTTNYVATNSFTASETATSIDGEIGNKLGADVHSVSRSAAPGIGSVMFIRGLGSLNADAQPLIVVDGVELDMQRSRASLHDGQFNNILANVSPDDIDKVTVLKNATALYGARGANGVIIIETKRGHSMATRIDANLSVGFSLIPQLPTMMNAAQYRTYATEMLGTISDNTELVGNNKIDYRFLNDDPNGYYYNMYHNDTDWSDYVYRNAMTQNYSINVQGGDNVGMYNLSVGYMKAESTADKNDFDRMNIRFNTDISILPTLDTKFDISYARTNNNVFDDGIPSDFTSGVITSPTFLGLIKSPLVSPYQYNAILGGFSDLLSDADEIFSQLGDEYSLANPVSILTNASGDNRNKAENTYFNIRLEPTLKLGNDFRVTERLSYVLNRNSQRYQRPYEGVPSFYIEGVGSVRSMAASLFSKEQNFTSDSRLDWAHQFGKHTLAAFVGFKFNYFAFDGSDLSTQYNASTTTNDKNPTLSSSSSEYPGVDGSNDVWKTLQWYGNVDYNYMNRYFVTLSLMAEANSRFGDNADGLNMFGVQWALFPSVQLGWVMTNESWFPKDAGIDYLRINAGFDMSGNDDISNYAARTSYSAVRYNQKYIGIQLTNIGNDKIQWETTTKWNFGFESYLLNNRIGVGFDFFVHNTKNLLTMAQFSTPVAGITKYWNNGGELSNTGFEANLSFKPVVSKNWNVEVGATIGHYKNEVKKLPNGDYTSSVYGEDNILTSVGNPVGVFYGYKTLGVFSTDAEAKAAGKDGADYLKMEDNTGATQDFKAGDIHFVDMNGDGFIDENDKTIIGDPNPDIYGNIFATVNWKNLTLSLGLNYSLGNDIYNYQRSVLNSGSTLYNQQVAEVGRWRYEGQQATLPRAVYGDPMGNNRFSDRWIEDGSYLRLKTVRLSYRVPVPGSWTWLQGLTVWGEGQNLLTFTKYTGSDPEVNAGNGVLYQGIDCGNIALGRNFSLGVKINL